MEEDIVSPDSPEQSSQQRFRTTSVCVKMKFDALQENVVTGEKNFIVVHEMYQCSKCYKIFNEESTLTNHDCLCQKESGSTSNEKNASAKMLNFCRQGKKYVYDCDQCELSFTRKVMLRKHRYQTHSVKRINNSVLECIPCNLKFTDKTKFFEHKKSFHVQKWFQCDQCDKRFAYERSLDWHVRKHLKTKRTWQCEICEKVMSSRSNLYRHRALHNLKRFTCEICSASFALKAYLKRHSVTHSEERPYMCEKCGKTYKTKKALDKHSLTHVPKAFQPENGKPRNYSKPVKKFTCDKCGKRFASSYYLKIHYFIHTGERPHKCHICPKGFRYKELLKNHLFVHSDIRFTCETCDRQYANKGAYQKHMYLHNEAKAIPCDHCDMLFSSRSALISHTVVHTKEKPYECELCHKRYSQKGSLNKHPCSRAAAKSTAEILLNLISRNDAS